MPRFAANVSMMYPDVPLLERYAAAARDGFRAVECLFPYEVERASLRDALEQHGLSQVLINTPAGDPARGDRGLAGLPGRVDEFRRALDQAMDYARALGCPRIHVMAGVCADPLERERHLDTLRDNLAWAGKRLRAEGLTGLVEPINGRDIPGYLVNTQGQAHALVAEAGSLGLGVQMDLYHCQIVEGDVATRIRRYIGAVEHVQIAGVPDRHEPDEGELNYPYLFALLDALGYTGWVGCEYRPRGATSEGLGWVRPWLNNPDAGCV